MDLLDLILENGAKAVIEPASPRLKQIPTDDDDDKRLSKFRLSGDGCYMEYERLKGYRIYWIVYVATPPKRRRQGCATSLLTYFFKNIVGRAPGPVDPGVYSKEGEKWLKPVFDRLGVEFNVKILDDSAG